MIITRNDLHEAVRSVELERHDKERYELYMRRHEDDGEFKHKFHSPVYFARRPHLLLPLGFDSHRVLTKTDFAYQGFRHYELEPDFGIPHHVSFRYESVYRLRDSGSWYLLDGFWASSTSVNNSDRVGSLHFAGPTARPNLHFDVDRWLTTLERAVEHPLQDGHTLWVPQRWTPLGQRAQRLLLADSTGAILAALAAGKVSLRDLRSYELEELVAELLRDRGFEIYVTPRTHDGGRDVVCRANIGAEPLEVAVEVKQQAVVGLGDVQRTLYANASYPIVMIATSGRFSAGVIAEKVMPKNRLRLWLKDGVAVSQWIDAYRVKSRGSVN